MNGDGLWRRRQNRIWFLAGMLAVLASVFPVLLLGKDAIFTYHDQLDGEVIAYCLQARHLFRGSTLPEFMNGASKTALTLPAPACVLLFMTGDACFGLTVMLLVGRLTGYVGMALLAGEVTENHRAAVLAGVLFAWLPFLPVYGLSQFGIPLLFWGILQLRRKRYVAGVCLYTVFFGLTSSLVLVGFGLLGMGVLWLIWCLWRERESFRRSLCAWLLLLGTYMAENFRLLTELLGIGQGTVSHKSEYTLAAASFWPEFTRFLTRGGQHSEDYHLLPVAFALAAGLLGAWKRTQKAAKLQRVMGICLAWNVFFALAAALWNGTVGILLRGRLSALGAFQLDRLLWIAPSFWYLLFACGLALCMEGCTEENAGKGIRIAGKMAAGALTLAALATGGQILLNGDVKLNVQKLRNPDYAILSLRDYYALGVMEQVETYLRENTGQEQEAYRVVSLGIDPAAALYAGFYCLDGYSNNYSLEYKHAFREVLKPELERSEYLRTYFDGWGNRCYLFSSECPGYYTIEKGGFYFRDYRLNTEALARLGATYLFSAAYIENAQEQGLQPMRDEPFETEESYYRIYVYRVKEQ